MPDVSGADGRVLSLENLVCAEFVLENWLILVNCPVLKSQAGKKYG